MEKKRIIINIPFNVNTFHDNRLTKEWISERISIFNRFTLKSLKNQSNQDFIVMAQYEDETRAFIEQALLSYEVLPGNILFVSKSNFREQIVSSLTGYDQLYIVRLDSDDMYHSSFIQQLHDFCSSENTEAILNQKGYIYDCISGRLAHYFDPSPPFYTLVYKAEDYADGKRYKISGGHPGVIMLKHEILYEPNYMVVIHSSNNATTFNIRQRKGIIENEFETSNILKDFMGE